MKLLFIVTMCLVFNINCNNCMSFTEISITNNNIDYTISYFLIYLGHGSELLYNVLEENTKNKLKIQLQKKGIKLKDYLIINANICKNDYSEIDDYTRVIKIVKIKRIHKSTYMASVVIGHKKNKIFNVKLKFLKKGDRYYVILKNPIKDIVKYAKYIMYYSQCKEKSLDFY